MGLSAWVDNCKKGGFTITHFKVGGIGIESAGYDPQCELLEIKFSDDGQVWQYGGVPEELWYNFKGETRPDMFFHKHIKGCFRETKILHK